LGGGAYPPILNVGGIQNGSPRKRPLLVGLDELTIEEGKQIVPVSFFPNLEHSSTKVFMAIKKEGGARIPSGVILH